MNDVRPVSLRLRLYPEDVRKLELVQKFLGLRSISATAARLALWNADEIEHALHSVVDPFADPLTAALGLGAGSS